MTTADFWPERSLFEQDHQAFRGAAAEFIKRSVAPNVVAWDDAGLVPRSLWLEAGEQGMLGLGAPAEYGGGGTDDFRFRYVLVEELAKVNAASITAGFSMQSDIVLPYIVDLGTAEQKQKWIPGLCSGEIIGAIGMTEPGAGSDLQGIRTSARRDGDDWVLNGSKIFITNGILAGITIVVARTDPSAGSRGFSLFVVEDGMPGFSRGRKLDKVGLRSQDTAELIFEDVRVPAANLLGREGGGFGHLMERLPLERLSIAICAMAGARAAIDWTLTYVRDRTAFGRSISEFQNTRFVLAELVTEVDIAQAYIDASVTALNAGTLSDVDAAKAKWWTTELHSRVVDRCVQLFGGYGFMLEYPIARAYTDSRAATIYGGTTEIMKHIIGKNLFPTTRPAAADRTS